MKKVTTPRMTDGYSDTYKKLGVSEKDYVKMRIKLTLVGIPALYLAFSSGSMPAFLIIMGIYCFWLWSIDPAEQIPRQRKAAEKKAADEEAIRADERAKLAKSMQLMMDAGQLKVERGADYVVEPK